MGGSIRVVADQGVVQVDLWLLGWGSLFNSAGLGGPAAFLWLELSTLVFVGLEGVVEFLQEVKVSGVDEEKNNLEWAAVVSSLVDVFSIE